MDRILSSGFNNSDISLLSSHETLTTYRSNENFEENTRRKKGHLTTEKHTKAPEGASAGAVAGGILGGSLGLLAGIGVLAIPGLGPLVAAGPILAALSGSAAGGSLEPINWRISRSWRS